MIPWDKDADGIVTLTMNAPEVRNALTGNSAVDEFEAACARINADASVRVMILTRAGTVFSSGGNVKEMAEKKPRTLDQMAGITGVGAKKLESYGTAFLEVITGAAESLHPARMKLVGRPEGALFDRLAEVQLDLSRGEDGTGKYLSCTHSTLRAIAERRPSTLGEMAAIQGMGEQKVERFGAAFLVVLRDE